MSTRQQQESGEGEACTVFVRNIPANSLSRHDLERLFSHVGPVKKCHIIQPKKSRASLEEDEEEDVRRQWYGFVKFVNEEDAKEAAGLSPLELYKQLDDEHDNDNEQEERAGLTEEIVKNLKLHHGLEPKKHKHQKAKVESKIECESGAFKSEEGESKNKKKRSSRVIVRNLSFLASESHVRTAMSAFGPLQEVHLPTVDLPNNKHNKNNNKNKNKRQQHRGFAFVTFTNEADARKAVQACAAAAARPQQTQGILIKKRMVAVDFALGKSEYQHKQQTKLHKANQEEYKHNRKSDNDDEDEDKDNDDNSQLSDNSNDIDSDSDDDGHSTASSDLSSTSQDHDPDTLDPTLDTTTTPPPPPKPKPNDLHENRTAFVRNLPHDIHHKTLRQFFNDRYSTETTTTSSSSTPAIRAVYLVQDPITHMCKGTAFLKFSTPHLCAQAIADSQRYQNQNTTTTTTTTNPYQDGFFLQGRLLTLHPAVEKRTAEVSFASKQARRAAAAAAGNKDNAEDDGTTTTTTTTMTPFSFASKQRNDKRCLYLKYSDHVSPTTHSPSTNNNKNNSTPNLPPENPRAAAYHHRAGQTKAWNDAPALDLQKRKTASLDKFQKLNNPLFFINPCRLVVRNLGKEVDERMLRGLVWLGARRGLGYTEEDGNKKKKRKKKRTMNEDGKEQEEQDSRQTNKNERNEKKALVSVEDVKRYLRAKEGWEDRDFVAKEAEARQKGVSGLEVPPMEIRNMRKLIPSVYIDREVHLLNPKYKPTTESNHLSPHTLGNSRGYGFVEFQHHTHALACLRELNNNPLYSKDYAYHGKKAAEEVRRYQQLYGGGGGGTKIKKAGKRKKKVWEFVEEEEGRVRVPRLIVEFAVENVIRARQQAERKQRQMEHAERQRLRAKELERTKVVEEGRNKGENSRKRGAAVAEDGEEGGPPKKKKLGRGAKQRERRRQKKAAAEAAGNEAEADAAAVEGGAFSDVAEQLRFYQQQRGKRRPFREEMQADEDALMASQSGDGGGKMKKRKKPKQKLKIDQEDHDFENMVRQYKKTLFGGAGKKEDEEEEKAQDETKKSKKKKKDVAEGHRWFE